MTDHLNATLQENVITLLCHNDEQGRLVSQLVNPNLFEGDYRTIAERAVEYWGKFNEAPKFHTADLMADILEDPHNRKATTIRNALMSMATLAPNLNVQYVLETLRKFVRLQQMKSTIVRSADRLNAQQDLAIPEIEGLWNDILRTRDIGFEPGIRLSDVHRMLAFIDNREREFDVGIPFLDARNAVPMRANVLLFLAGAGLGKTWFLINLGKRALAQRKKVVHITLELSEELTLQRYYQALFSLTKREPPEEGLTATTFLTDADGALDGFGSRQWKPQFHFKSSAIKDELLTRIQLLGSKFENVFIKRFPPKQLTPNMLRAYLDSLEATHKFIPDLIIVDYLKEMAIDQREFRLSLDATMSELRAIAVERNVAVATAQQLSKQGVEAAVAKSTHVAEAWALIGTTDVCLTYTCTDDERRYGLARLYVSKNREDEDHYGVVITQNYNVGQFVLQSMPLSNKYFTQLKELTGSEDEGGMNDNSDEG